MYVFFVIVFCLVGLTEQNPEGVTFQCLFTGSIAVLEG